MSFLKNTLKFIILLLIIFGGVYFALHNNQQVEVHVAPFLIFPPLPAYAVYGLCFFLGAVTACVFLVYGFFKKNLVIFHLNRRLRRLDKDSDTAETL